MPIGTAVQRGRHTDGDLDAIAVAAALAEYRTLPPAPPAAFAAALASARGGMATYCVSADEVLVLRAAPGIDAAEMWAGIVAWRQGAAA
jgi:hypothetical protein